MSSSTAETLSGLHFAAPTTPGWDNGPSIWRHPLGVPNGTGAAEQLVCLYDKRLSYTSVIQSVRRPCLSSRYLSWIGNESISKAVDRINSVDVIERSRGSWASSTFFISKQDGSIRFCVNYGRLNTVTRNELYATPRMDDCIDSLGSA
jgi:hypothetical protein